MKLPVKVVPGSSRNQISGWLGEALKVRVSAAAERGKANAAVKELLAHTLGISTDQLRIVKGNTSPRKLIEITGLSEPEVRSRLP